jgi:O-antigen/teichoic acid export membrane protein
VLQHLKNLFRSLAIYGVGDVATSLVSLLLLPVFTRYLTREDYGVITMLLSIEAVTKVAFRWGVDTAFIRLFYDCEDERARQRLTSTIFFFLLAVNGSLLVAALVSADWLAALLIGPTHQGLLVALTIANTFVAGFFFIPFQVLRIGGRSTEFISLNFARSAGTVVARLFLVVWAGLGVLGIVLADIVVTGALAAVMSRWFAPLIRPVFSRSVMREALGFGLPRVPHSIAHQIIGFADRYLLKYYRGLSEVGLYSIGATFGFALKLFLSAFETAWTPFFLAIMRDEPDPPRIYSVVSTYVVAALVLLVAGLCAVAQDLVRLFTTARYHDAALVTPWIALGVMFQGLYLVGSIGLVITKRTTFYPIATGLAAAASLLANILLIPRFGMLGAAWANCIAYLTLAVATVGFSWHVYPIQYEWSRLLRIVLAGGLSYACAVLAVPMSMPTVPGLVLRGMVTVAAYFLVLYVVRFFHKGELQVLRDIRRRTLERRTVRMSDPTPTDVEMAGEIVATAPEVRTETLDDDVMRGSPPAVSRGFRDPDR